MNIHSLKRKLRRLEEDTAEFARRMNDYHAALLGCVKRQKGIYTAKYNQAATKFELYNKQAIVIRDAIYLMERDNEKEK